MKGRLQFTPALGPFSCRKLVPGGQTKKASTMKDLAATLEKLLNDAEDCDFISKLASDKLKRDVFKRLADQLRLSAVQVERAIALTRTSDS